ncbi:unnamed protein product [Gulo gulo]|uniref:Uncharacterized protein n=1 Tax=Gulo gulo TaxID=48420 RepID=A0A9X9LDB5_GULGU|nr:unnamed protein product [Gulo gulo]
MVAKNEEGEHSVSCKVPAQKSNQEIQEMDKDGKSPYKNKDTLLGHIAVSADPSVPRVVVACLTLVCSPGPGSVGAGLDR